MVTWTDNIPDAGHTLANDQPLIENNFTYLASDIGVDHNFTKNSANAQDGYHTIIHQGTGSRTRSGTNATFANFPGSITNINQLFAASYTADYSGATADTQLFAKTGLGGVSQLTGNSTPGTNESEGWCWCGGILIQWGTVTFSGTSQQQGTVTFQNRGTPAQGIPFPNNIFIVNTTLHDDGGSNTSNVQCVSVFTLTRTSFKWNYTGSSAYDRFYWMAIGI